MRNWTLARAGCNWASPTRPTNWSLPPDGEDDCYSLALYCADVDAVLASALEAGATVREPATNFASGDRFASIRDPFGVRWSLMTRVADISEEESTARVAEWAAKQG